MSRFTNNTRLQSLVTASLCSLLMIGCLSAPEEEVGVGEMARVSLDIKLGSASASNHAAKAIVTMNSSTGETVCDTITEAGSRLSQMPVSLPAAGKTASIAPLYALAPRAAWNITVKTLDSRGTVLHLDSTNVEGLAAGDLLNVLLRLAPRFADYEAVFSLPTAFAKTGTRLSGFELAVDGVPVCDTAVTGAASSVSLTCGSLPIGNRTVTLRVLGRLAGETSTRVLFEGEKDVEITAAAPVEAMTLDAAAGMSQDGAQGFEVRLGRVGHVVMNVEVSGGVNI